MWDGIPDVQARLGHPAEVLAFPSIEVEANMALNDQDRAWICQEIQAAIKKRGFIAKVKEWFPVAAGVAILIFIATQYDRYVEFRTKTSDHIENIERDVASIHASMDAVLLKATAVDPNDPHNIIEARKVLAIAQSKKVKLDTLVVEQTGMSFLTAAANNKQAWATVEQYLAYRSFLNADYTPNPGELTVATATTPGLVVHLKPSPEAQKQQPKPGESVFALRIYLAGGYTTPDKAARLGSLSQPAEPGTEPNVGLYVVDGGKWDIIGLDDSDMKNVIIRNAIVGYDGGPVKLQNV